MRRRSTTALVALVLTVAAAPVEGQGARRAAAPFEQRFTLASAGEAVATITAACARCDWGVKGREAVALRVLVDGVYSQHVLLARGAAAAPYRVMLGPLPAGEHRLTVERDAALSAPRAGAASIARVAVAAFAEDTPEHAWLSQAPMIYARPGTVERFSDVPIMMWAERAPAPARGFHYSVIFTHEDGGTPTDRLMATWGRTTDIEFVVGIEQQPDGTVRQQFQGKDHEIFPFRGTRLGTHPLLWVSTDNNMFSDSGDGGIRFAPAPDMVTLDRVSREVVMDRHSWTYAVMAAELRREGRIDPAARPGSAKVPDVRQFAFIEACGDVERATLAFDVAVAGRDGSTAWHASDRGDARFRIARGGCFRAAVPVPPGTPARALRAVRVRAYTRPARRGEPSLPPGTGRVTLQRLNTVFMLDQAYRPGASSLTWTGDLDVPADAAPVMVPARQIQ